MTLSLVHAKGSSNDGDGEPKDSKKRAAKGRSKTAVKSKPRQAPKCPRGKSFKKVPPKARDKEEYSSSSPEPDTDLALMASGIRAQMEVLKNAGWSSSDDDDENARAKI